MMKKGIARFTAFCMAAGMTLGGSGIVSYATGADVSLVGVSSTTRAAVPAESETEETQTEESADAAGETTEAAQTEE